MKSLPHRISLASQTVEVLREAISEGHWQRWLPGELELSHRLQVSRATLRAALDILEREAIIRGGQGRRREILQAKPAHTQPPRKTVVLLSPAPLHRLPSVTVFWMDELREHLAAAGWPLEFHESAATYRRNPGKALEELASRLHPAGWLLYRSTPEMQRWFESHALPAVIAGSRHPGMGLASVDIDHRAACRHAAGKFRAAGHRHLAMVRPETSLAGDLESVAGFIEGAGSNVEVALHDGSVRGVCAGLSRLFSRESKPTGLFVFHATHLLTVLGWLHGRGLQVPAQVSVICRDDEPYLESVLPSPARYALKASAFARLISRVVAQLVTGDAVTQAERKIIPHFIAGETLGTAPVR